MLNVSGALYTLQSFVSAGNRITLILYRLRDADIV
jgi:hypothetical protein